MRSTLLLSAAVLSLTAGAAFAQVAPPTSAYRGGAGSPSSTSASNIVPSDTHSQTAPRLPNPSARVDTPEALLASAQRSLNAGRTGQAQQALEMAETRALSRTTDPSMASQPDEAAMVKHIGDARRALGRHDVAMAKSEITMAMNAPTPRSGPDVTTTTTMVPMTQPVLGAPLTRY